MARKLIFRPLAEADLVDLDSYIAQESPERARAFVLDVQTRLSALAEFPDVGRARDDIAPGLRVFALDRRVTIAYRVTAEAVEIVCVSYRGRDLDALLVDREGA